MSKPLQCIAVLHYGRPEENLKWFFDDANLHEEHELNNTLFLLASNMDEEDVNTTNLDGYIDVTMMSVAEARNAIIEWAGERNVTDLHIVDDDIEITNKAIFHEYEEISKKLDIPYINNGFATERNYVLHKPNPRVKCHLGRFGTENVTGVCFNAFINNGYSYYDLTQIGDRRYNEELTCIEEDEYVFKLIKDGYLPFFNFFLDIENSWEYINRLDPRPIRKVTEETIAKDKQYLAENGIQWEAFNDVDTIIRYIVGKVKEQ